LEEELGLPFLGIFKEEGLGGFGITQGGGKVNWGSQFLPH